MGLLCVLSLALILPACTAREVPVIATSYTGYVSTSNCTSVPCTPVGSGRISVLSAADKPKKILSVMQAHGSSTNQSSLTIPQNEWNQSTSVDYNSSSGSCQYSCKNGTSCGSAPSAIADSFVAQFPLFGNPPPPPPPAASCAVGTSALFIEPWILLQLFPATPGGQCIFKGITGELWSVKPNVTVGLAEFCIDTSVYGKPIPLYATLSITHYAKVEFGYASFVPGPPPASTFYIPADCRC